MIWPRGHLVIFHHTLHHLVYCIMLCSTTSHIILYFSTVSFCMIFHQSNRFNMIMLIIIIIILYLIWFDYIMCNSMIMFVCVSVCVIWHICIICEYLVLQYYKCYNWWSYSYQYGHTPLYVAASNGHLEIVLLLVEGGASIDDLDQVSLGRNISCLRYCSQLYLSWFGLIWFDLIWFDGYSHIITLMSWISNH